MNSTDSAQSHQATLDLLAEVGDYLSRLPVHPMTRAMHQKVLAHLSDPFATVTRDRLVELAAAEKKTSLVRAGQSFSGVDHFTPSGLPRIECRLLYPELRIESPAYQFELVAGEDSEALLLRIAKDIAQGLTIRVSQDVLLHRAHGTEAGADHAAEQRTLEGNADGASVTRKSRLSCGEAPSQSS